MVLSLQGFQTEGRLSHAAEGLPLRLLRSLRWCKHAEILGCHEGSHRPEEDGDGRKRLTCTRCPQLIAEPICFECGRKKPWVAGPRVSLGRGGKRRPSADAVPVEPPKGPKPLAGDAGAKKEMVH